MILERLVVGPFASNCYIVGSEQTKEGMIIDPGDEAEQILKKGESSPTSHSLPLLSLFFSP